MDVPIHTVMSFCNAFWAMLIQSKDVETIIYAYEALEKSGANHEAMKTILRSRLEELGNDQSIVKLIQESAQ